MKSHSYAAAHFLPSPSEPLLPPRSSLAHFAAHHAQNTLSDTTAAAATASSSLGLVAWSVAEAAVCHLPRIEKPGEKGGDGVRVEKTLFDAFGPLNATVSLALAFLNGAVLELNRSGKINDFANYIAGDLDEDESSQLEPSLPWEWDRVGHDTCVGLTKDVVGQTLARSLEKSAKPRLSHAAYVELLKHPHKAARKVFDSTRPCGSRVSASYKAGAVVALSPTFFGVRALTMWLADVFVDGVALYRQQMSRETFGQNAALKLAKHSINGLFCIALGAAVPFLSPNFYVFVAIEQLVGALATDAIIARLGTIEPS